MMSFYVYIYNRFKCHLFYEMKKRGLEKCWFDHYYELRNDGIFYFQAISKDGDRKFKVHISFDKREYDYFDDLVSLFKLHTNWIFEISEYDFNMDAFNIIFTKPIYTGSKKEFYRISSNGIDKRYDIDYRPVYIDDDTRAWIDKAAYDNLAVNNARLRLAMNSVYGLPTFKFGSAPTLSKPPIFNPPATICYWTDGTKTVVKCQEEDTYSPEAGLALCYMKKILGNTSRDLNKELHKYIPEEKGE